MDTKFSTALHILSMISESNEELSSQRLATSVGTNSSYIRKVIAFLKNANIIDANQGKVGYRLLKEPKKITLLEIYKATQQVDKITLFEIHKNPNEQCPVGKNIGGALSSIFGNVEKHFEDELKTQTLDDVIADLYKQAKLKQR